MSLNGWLPIRMLVLKLTCRPVYMKALLELYTKLLWFQKGPTGHQDQSRMC